VPLAFSDIRVEDYMSAMIAIYELEDVQPLVDLYIYSYLRTCAAYDSTVKAIGFDEVRVRYQKDRRAVVREVILMRLKYSQIRKFVEQMSDRLIPNSDYQGFIEDIMEDLEQMDESRLARLGVTIDQLQVWKSK